jgi:hypothetical protein
VLSTKSSQKDVEDAYASILDRLHETTRAAGGAATAAQKCLSCERPLQPMNVFLSQNKGWDKKDRVLAELPSVKP